MGESFTYGNMNRLIETFPSTPQAMTYTGFDKADKIKQGNDSLCYTYGYDRQRIFMEEHVGNTTRTKHYVGNCEYVTETTGNTTTSRWLTYLSGPTGVYAVVETENGTNTLRYILKDNLSSWTTITSSTGTVEQRLSYDAWGNLRNPNTWNRNFNGTPMFDRGFTGHEHLYNFGLINMNGRMYDPVMSVFLSVDQYVQSPENAQGFNRYAYCMYNPLRYVNPTGWLSGGGGDHFGKANNTIGNIPPQGVVVHNGNMLFLKTFLRYQIGALNNIGLISEDYWVDASTININEIDLIYRLEKNDYVVNLFNNGDLMQGLALGHLVLNKVGEYEYTIQPDEYDFRIESYRSFGENAATIFGWGVHYFGMPFFLPKGTYTIRFYGTVTTKH